jgi:hypothetical protein
MNCFGRAPRLVLLALLGFGGGASVAQSFKDQLPPEMRIQRTSGDSIQPVFDGWQRYPDGTLSLWFSYYNRNSQEEVNVPVGPDNRFSDGVDHGQPAYFYPKRHQYVFRVNVPKDWGPDQKLIWTVTSRGETCTAIGWLQPEWEVDDGVRQMNAGGAGLAPPADPPNIAPKITAGSSDQTVEFGKPVKLSVSATDDGIPKPRGPRGGLGIKWILYRGPAQVNFNPSESTPVYGKPLESTTEATFSRPGSYWLQAIASDGLLDAVHNVKVTVNASQR